MGVTSSNTDTEAQTGADNAFVDELNDLLQKDDTTNTDVLQKYELYAQDYDRFMVDVKFEAPELAAEYFDKHAQIFGLSKDCVILDIGAGTGRCGFLLQSEYGYTTVDGIDPCEGMLDHARNRGVYRNLFVGKVGAGHKIPTDDDTYDAAVVSGCIAPKHMPCDAFLEVIRVVKPGGIIVNSMREEFTWRSADCHIRKPFAQWEAEGMWTIVEWTIPENEHCKGKEALVNVYKVCSGR